MRSGKKSRRTSIVNRQPRAPTSQGAVLVEQLQTSEAQLALVADAGLGTWTLILASGQLSCSARCREIFAIPAEEPLTSALFEEIMHPDDRPRIERHVSDALASKRDCEAEFRIIRRDGSLRWLTARGRCHYGADGKPTRIEGIVRDVTERTLAIEKMQRSLERIKALRDIETAITSTLELDRILELLLSRIDALTRYAAATVRLVNRDSGRLEPVAAKNINVEEWKRSFSKIPGGLSQLVLQSSVPIAIPDLQQDPRTRHQDFMRHEGLVSFLGLPLIAKNEVLGVLAVFTRERHLFDDEEVEFLTTVGGQAAIAIHNAQLYEEMVKANNVKEEFLGVMSHELRTPLSVIMGYSSMLVERILGEINPEQEQALRKILTWSAEQLNLINAIIQTTQLESRSLRVDRHPVPVSQLMSHVRDEMTTLSRGKEVSLEWSYPTEAIEIVTDTPKVIHILRNLIGNAIKFTHRGTVTIQAEIVSGENAPRGAARSAGALPQLKIRVTDTGIGIPRDQWERIFEKFHQVDGSQTRLYGGMGLGLYVARSFAEMLGGSITVDSQPECGSTFLVTIPCDAPIDHRF
jgi:PAS domain S-box-containing protein